MSKKTVYNTERKLVIGAFCVFLVVSALYVYFISAAIVHVIVRKEINQEIAQVSSRLSELETIYIETKDDIREEEIEARGFTFAVEKVFITKAPASLVLSENDEG